MTDYGAYIDGSLQLAARRAGALDGLRFAVKDVFALEGHISTAGNPHWRDTHEPAEHTAAAIRLLLDHGARLQGTTVTDELMYSLQGENIHYGTPVNTRAPDRIPGGSSGGSAVAAAAGLADFAMGTDTGGSVRIPSSYCGVFGFRPTHGAVSAEGVIPLAPSFDTVGWMSRDPQILLEVGRVLLGEEPESGSPSDCSRNQSPAEGAEPPPASRSSADGDEPETFGHIYWPDDAWEQAEEAAGRTLAAAAAALLAGSSQSRLRLAPEDEGGLGGWADIFRNLQGREIWEQHGAWIATVQPRFGPGIAERFHWASGLTQEDRPAYEAKRREIDSRLASLLGNNRLLVIPTAPGEAPALGQAGEAADRQRSRAMRLTCIAGLAGLPQITIPFMSSAGFSIGLSLIAGRGQDLKLLQWVSGRMADGKGGKRA
ncbi:MAG: amidase [Paenibacillaceae bacterium]|jgi:amidase|nr:amidase [Paenibacillaceae bacterium]